MFEDQQAAQPQKNPAPQTNSTPASQPTPQPQPQAQPVVPPAQEEKKVEDIFGHIDKDVPVPPPVNVMPGAGGAPIMPTAPTSGGNKMVLIIVVVVIVVLILGAGIYFAWGWFKASNNTNNTVQQTENLPATDETGAAKGKVPPPEVIESVPVGIDSDSDGLTDAEEITAGTNPMEVDTDKDNLFDYDEVKVYKTNPVVADSDGDGYKDGDEVKNGFDPNGPGKLLNLQDELKKINGVD